MNEHSADKPHDSGDGPDTRPRANQGDPTEARSVEGSDLLDDIDEELDRLADVDPADSVAALAEITASLNREIDADEETS